MQKLLMPKLHLSGTEPEDSAHKTTTLTAAPASRRLSEYVEHYEPLEYDAEAVHAHHKRTRRSASPPDLHISFHAHERHFKMRLRRDLSAFSEDFKVEGSQGQLHDVDTSHIYHGELVDNIIFLTGNGNASKDALSMRLILLQCGLRSIEQ
ncbi:jg10083 [Pararge aegeria aegeria]|uniref:Jg10083 protein n=1 Tax=Pararge aegeria aegeria TaxID=348720 RepID=A0A8S4SB89_9NEOP|nr:jg10083 [Pararge aegeria aegeria]